MLNEMEIKKQCIENGYNYKYFNDVAIIVTGMDMWKLEHKRTYDNITKDYKDIIKVKHLNKSGNKKQKAHFHTQRYAQDVDYIFKNIIVPHENGDRVFQKTFRIKEILAQHI